MKLLNLLMKNNINNCRIRIKSSNLLRLFPSLEQNNKKHPRLTEHHELNDKIKIKKFLFYTPNNLKKKSKLFSSNKKKLIEIQNISNNKINEEINEKTILYKPIKTDFNSKNDNSINVKEEKKYRKISKEKLNNFKESINKYFQNYNLTKDDFSTKEETIKKKRSKSTSLIVIDNSKETLISKNRRKNSNKSDIVEILDNTINSLKKLKTIILDDEIHYKDDEINYKMDEINKKEFKISKKKKLKIHFKNGLNNKNPLVRNSIIKRNINFNKYKKKSLITDNFLFKNNEKNIDNKIHKENNKRNSFLLGNKNAKIKNYDTEVRFNLPKNNSLLINNIIEVEETYNKLKQNMKKMKNNNKMKKQNKILSYSLTNFEFSD